MIKNKDYKASNFIYCYVLDSANVVVVGLLEYSPANSVAGVSCPLFAAVAAMERASIRATEEIIPI